MDLHTPLLSFNDHNATDRIPEILNQLSNYDIAITTDAGTPGVSDPGNLLVDAAISQGHTIVSIPGPSAVTSAISICPFIFLTVSLYIFLSISLSIYRFFEFSFNLSIYLCVRSHVYTVAFDLPIPTSISRKILACFKCSVAFNSE